MRRTPTASWSSRRSTQITVIYSIPRRQPAASVRPRPQSGDKLQVEA
ncbi:hypothetical protein ACU4HD_43365 [Cupriavidus basilensis]